MPGPDEPTHPPAPTAAAWDNGVLERRLLALHNRRRIVNHVRANPGVHLRQVARDLGLAIGTAEHHLHLLVRYGILASHPVRHHTAYFLRDGASPEHHRLVAALRGRAVRAVVRALADDPDLDAPALARRLRMPPTSLSHHLRHLIDDGHVEALRVGRSRLLRLRHPELAEAALRAVEQGPLAAFPWSRPDAEPDLAAALEVRDEDREPDSREGTAPPADAAVAEIR